jgi:hypothetical protein
MSSQACTVLPNDKEPGYTVVSVEDVLSIHQSILSKSCYVEVDPDLWVEGTMLKEYRILCNAAAGVEGDLRFSSMLGRSTRAERGEILARLVFHLQIHENILLISIMSMLHHPIGGQVSAHGLPLCWNLS